MRSLFGLLLLVPSLLSQLSCPGGASFFDFEACDPTRRSQCPAGFACRRGSSASDPAAVVYLCCDSSVMFVSDWFNEAGLTPSVVPQTPLTQIPVLKLGDLGQGTASPEIHISDEIITLTFPDFTTAMVNDVRLNNNLPPGGFIHGITLVDPLTSPWALFASLNIAWPGGQYVDLTAARKGNGLFFSHIANATVPEENSYRSQYVVLLYQTQTAIPTTFQNEVANCEDAACVFNRLSPFQGGSPIAGSFFYLTTARPMFAVGPATNSASPSSMILMMIPLIIAKYFF